MSSIQNIKAADLAADKNASVEDPAPSDAAEAEAGFEPRRIARPHPDIELGVARSALEYLVRLPDAGLNPETGLILFLAPYGMPPCGAYARKLLPYLANKYNCLAASIEYFGSDLWNSKKCRWIPHPAFFAKLKEHYGIEVAASKVDTLAIATRLSVWLAENGRQELHPDCLLMGVSPEYDSMGFLPALDGLQLAHRLVDDFALDKRRLFLLGSSYGGYVASLMVKFAPRTFRMAVDNSGFSAAADDIWNVFGLSAMLFPGKVKIHTRMALAFSNDPAAPNFFSLARFRIRNLLARDHVHEGTVRLYAYHAVIDDEAKPEMKVLLRDIYAGRIQYELEMIDESKIDGRIFKEICHGMRASLRGLFDLSYAKFERDGGALADDTDFDRESRYFFPCGNENYTVQFSRRDGVRAEIVPAT